MTRGPGRRAGLALALAAAACSDAPPPPSDPDGRFTVQLAGAPADYQPGRIRASADALAARLVFDGLVNLDDDGRLQPGLATRWEADADGRTVTFHLRSGVRFHDGTPLTAGAVRLAWHRALRAGLAAGIGRGTLHELAGAGALAADSLAPLPGVVALDDSTLRVTLERPNPGFVPGLAGPNETVAAPASTPSRPVGTGPWRFVARDSAARTDRYAAVPGHWTPPRLAELFVRFRPPAEEPATVADGAVDYVRLPPVLGLQGARAEEGVAMSPPLVREQVAINHQLPGLREQPVRAALAAALDVDRFLRDLGDSSLVRATGPLPPVLAGGRGRAATHDAALARRVLGEAAGRLPRPLHLWVEAAPDSAPSRRFVRYLVAAFADAGVAVRVRTYRALAEIRSDSLAALVYAPIQPFQLDPRAYVAGYRPGRVDMPLSVGFSVPATDSLLARLMAAGDSRSLAHLGPSVHARLADDVAALFLWFRPALARYNLAYAGVRASPFLTRFLEVHRR